MKHKKKYQVDKQQLAKCSLSLEPRVKEIICDLGFSLEGLSFEDENQTNYLRVTVSHPLHSVSINDCELISKEVEKELDLLNPIPFSYILEVQSPGFIKHLGDSCEHQFELKNLGLVIKS